VRDEGLAISCIVEAASTREVETSERTLTKDVDEVQANDSKRYWLLIQREGEIRLGTAVLKETTVVHCFYRRYCEVDGENGNAERMWFGEREGEV
jgi:hypothetical protein